ncbi:MaoC family dehydratase [Phytohabitans rumicis]|uniref:MaoC family dehydratase n=1 Tax=Phytohabitans rumicis TaxID=1076125 RepID=UPI001563DE3B
MGGAPAAARAAGRSAAAHRHHPPAARPPRQYADASGDHNPIHLDDDFARAAGLPGVIVHGLASLAIATGVVLSASGKTGLRRLGCRFTRPVAPGDTLTTRVWAHEGGYRFDAVDGHDQVVLGSGVAILTP